MNILFVILSVLFTGAICDNVIHYQPEAVHISYGGKLYYLRTYTYFKYITSMFD